MSEFGSKFLGSIGPVADYSNNSNNTSGGDQQLSGLGGLASSAFHNIINGAENAVGGAFQWAGQQRLAGERDLINNALSDAGIDSSESLNNYSSPIGNAISGLGNHMSEQSEIDNRPYASYESNGGMERFSNPNYYTDPRGLTADVANGIGSSIPSILATIPLGGLGAGGKVAANASKMEKLGGILKDMGTFGMINGFNEAVSDAGSIVDDLRNQGYTEEQIADATNALIADETPMLAASDAITGGLLGGGFKNLLGKGIVKNAVGHAGLIASDAAGEGVTEMRQQQLQKGYLGQPHGEWFNGVMPDEAYAGAAGFAGGLGMSGMGAAGGAIRNHFQNRGQQDDVPSADNNGSVNPPEDVPQVDAAPSEPQADAVDAGFDKYDGQRMQNGRNGCVEAVGKIGAEYSPFLAKENESGQVNVSGLVSDAQKDGVPVIPFDESVLQKGDVIVFGDEDHVLIADGNGGYFGNSSNADGPDAGGHVLHGTDIYGLGKDLQPTKIIKTGSGDFQPGFSGQQAATANEAQQPASESSKPLFDMNDDSMLAQFAENMKDSSGDPATIEYFKGMFKEDRKGNDVFRATDEQKHDMQRRYAAELDDFATQNSNKVSAANQQPANNQNQLMPSVMAPYNTMDTYRTIPGVPAQTRVHTQPMDTVQQIAMAEPAKEADARKQQGQAILLLAAGKGTSLEDKLAAGLRAGYARAITTAQERLANNGISVPAAEAVMNGRMNNNENSQSISTATAAQGSNTENQHENSVPQQSTAATEEVKVVPQAYRGTYVDKTPDYDARYRGGIKNGVIDVWQYDFMKKADAPVMSMSLDEVRKAANRYGNSMAGLRELIKEKRDAAVEKWINDSPNTKLREARRDNWENDTLTGKLSAIENRGIDSALHVAAHLYEKATGEKPMSGWEKQEKKLKASNKAQEKSAQNVDSAQWIASHKFSYDTNKSVDENIHIAEQMSQEYIDHFGTTDKINTPERDALRRNIVDRLYGNGAKKKGNEVYLIVGLPASGKSTIANSLVKEHGAIIIDSDEAKKLLPEFSNGLLATAVHEESSIITNQVINKAMDNGDNIVMPIVGKTYSSLKRKIDGFRLSGYKINLVYVELPVEKAIERVKNRFKEEGRLVSPKYLASVGLKPKENYDKLKSDKEVDSYEAWNNDVRRGQQPILLEQGPSESGMGRLRDKRYGLGESYGSHKGTPSTKGKNANSEQVNHSDNQGGFSMSGKQATVISDNGNEVKVHYKIVPADSLITSNSAKRGLAVNPAYPKELQPRDRQRVAMEQQVTEMSHNLRPEDLADSRNLNEGAPIVRSDKVVLNGNGRSISIIRALKGSPNSKVAKSYYKYLVSNAERLGFDRQAVLDMVIGKKEPILVREVDGNISDKAMQDIIGSTAGGSRMGASEQAKADAKKITADSLSRYVDNVTGDLTSAANRDFVSSLLYNITSKNDVNAYLDDKGHVNADGIQRVKRALFSLAYGDDELISKMAESMDDNIRNISNALMAAAPSMASLNIKIRDGRAYNIDLAGTISEATKRLDYLRQNGQPVENYLSNQSMFSEYQDTPEMQEVLRYFDKNKRKSKNVAKFIERAVDSIDSMGDPNQETLITTEEKTLGDVIRQAEGDVEDGGQTGLFMDEGSKSGSNEVLQPSERERKEDVRPPVQEREDETDEAVPSGRGQAGVNKEESPKKAAKSRQRTFADRSVADEEMLKAFGIKKNDADKSSHKLVDDSDEAMEKYAEQIRKELNKLSVNPIFNTNLTVPAFKLATAYIQRGVTKFADFCGKMLDTLGDNIKPWLKSIWNAAASYEGDKLDEGKLTMMLQAVGSRYEDGITSYDDMRNDIEKLIGKDNMADVEPYIKAAFNGVEAYYKDDIPAMKIEEDGVNESDVRTGGVAERSGKGNDQDSVGRHDENEGSGRGGVEGVRPAGTEVRPQRGVRVRDSGTAAGRETGNRGVQAEKSADRSGSAGSPELSGSVRDSYERDTSLDDGRRGRDIEAPGNRRNDEGNPLKTESGKKAKAGAREASINRDLPMLLPEQRGDVLFMETRLHENGAQGTMLTNGTGTGKTFSGMGIVKRMVDQGKKNILIVTPSDEVNKQWVKAAKEFFHINIHTLKDEADAGKGVTITTYANYGANAAIVSREWDMVIQDESQKLMENEQGKNTHALEKLRALTYHKRGLSYRFKFLHPDEYKRLDDIDARLKDKDNPVPYEEHKRLDKERGELYSKLSKAENDQVAEWKKIPQQDKPKVVMLSATPFSRVTNIDYAEGYLFDYGDKQSDVYNDTDAKEQFFVQHFGYRMRYNKLTRPDANVDNSLMEMEFYDWLKSTGAVAGRSISIDKDYDRGFLLTPNAVGTMMDKGFDALREDDRFKDLYDVLDKAFNSRRRNYLLEFIKAKEAVPVIREYLKRGKKVVVFHQAMKEQEVSNPFLLPDHFSVENNELRDRVHQEYALFQAEHPELYRNNMGMDGLLSPVETMLAAFGDKAGFYNGGSDAKRRVADSKGNKMDARSRDVAEFNDDNGGKKVLVVQQDAGNAGISLHDTTGKFQRVLINLAIPKRPTYAIQTEGRIYRVGSASDAIIRYLTTGTDLEKGLFASTVASRSSTAENLSMGSAARNLRDSFRNLYMETMDGSWVRRNPGHPEEGTGGKEMDHAVNDAVTDYDRAKTHYYGQQKRTAAMKSMEGNDYFSTPEPIGYKMVQWAKHPEGGSILEPSAGHGAISQWFAPNSDQTIIEPSGKLAPLAQMNTPNAKLIHDSFENHNIINKYDSVVMNPPFGTGGKTAIEHVAKAFKHLRDGGRLVAIIPDGPSCQKHLDKWLYGNPDGKTKAERGEESAVLMRTVELPAAAFERAGTKVMTKIIIIDKQESKSGREAAAAEAGGDIDLRGEKDINSLFDRMENMGSPDRVSTSASLRAAETSSVPNAAASSNGSKELDIDGHTVFVSRDGYVSGDTYPVKKDIKMAGARWDSDRKAWHFTDPVKAKEFVNSYSDEKVDITDADRKASEAIFTLPNDTTAQANNRLDYNEEYLPLKSLAAKHGGKYERRTGFTFSDKAARDSFVKEAEAFLAASPKLSIAWHGSPYDFDSFSTDNIGSGEGAQAHGWGLYFAGDREVSEEYRKNLGQYIEKVESSREKYIFYHGNGTGWTKEDKADNRVDNKHHDILSAISEYGGTDGAKKHFYELIGKNEEALKDEPYWGNDFKLLHGVNASTLKSKNAYYESLIKIIDEDFSNANYSKQYNGKLFKVDIPASDTMLDEEKKIENQPVIVQKAIKKIIHDLPLLRKAEIADNRVLEMFCKQINGKKETLSLYNEALGMNDEKAAYRLLSDSFVDYDNGDRFAHELSSDREMLTKERDAVARSIKEYETEISSLSKDIDDKVLSSLNNFSGKKLYDELSREFRGSKNASMALNDAGINGISYDGYRDGRCFVVFDDKAIKIIEKYSASGPIASMMSKVEFAPDSALDGHQTAIRDFGEKMGVPVVFFDGPADLHGFHSRGITFLNRKSAVSIPWTFWHETFHWLKQNNPKLYADMVKYISGKEGFSQEQLDAYREDIGRPELSDGETIEEMMADAMPDVKRRVTFMKSLARENMTLAQRLVAWIKDIMDRVCDVFHTPVVGLTNTQIAAFKGAFVRLARDMVDANGNHVFRVNEEKNDIRLPGGRLLESIDYSIDNKHSDNQGAFSIGKQDRSYFDKAKAKLEKKFSLSSDKVEVHETTRDSNSMNPWRRYVMSPSRLAKKVPAFKLFYEYANRAMNKLTALRSDYARKLDSTMQLVKRKEDRQALYELLAQGDAEGKEYSQAELADSGVNENVSQAYKQVRQLMTKAYHMLNDARRRVQTKSEHANSKKIADLQKNKFVEIIKDSENEDGSHTVTYREQANWKRIYEGVTQEALDGMKKDDAMQILSADEAGEDENGDKLYNVEAREAIPDINKRGGYIPHFFHEYMVRLREKDDAGNVSYHVVGSGRTVSDAVSVANAYLKNHKTAAADKLIVSPKVFDFSALGMDESQYAAVMGDNDYKRMVDTLAAKNDMTLAEARDMVKGAAKMKNRHRFFGNFLQRKGAEGYEKDMDWVLRHYFNSACRYTAMETEFKPKAISLFERIHGDFNKEYKGVAQYTKEYINDVNGVPSALEDSINTMLNNNFIWRRMIASNFGDRAALSVASTISNKVSILKLGFLNVSSALINLTQAANAAAYIGDPRALYQAIAKGAHRKYNMHDLRILVETGVMNDIGLDSGSGYDINRIFSGDSSGIRIGSHEFNGKAIKALKALNHVTNVLGNKSMFLFKQSEGIIRRGTVLAAYNEGIKRGMSHNEAIEFAKDVNRKSNFDYGVHDAPNMFRRGSVISQLLLQFKKYPIKELEVMRDMFPLLSNNTSTKQKALFWGTYFLMAGVCQVPFGDWWDDFMQMFGIHPKDSLKKGLMELAGDDPSKKMVAKIMMYGAGSLAGVDISSRTGIADVIPTKISDALGPTISTLRQLGQADGAMQRIRALSPGLSNILMAYTGKSIGARGRVGSEYNTAYDRILRALGFRSVDEAVDSDIQNIYYDQKDTQKKDKQKAVDDYLENPTTDNAKRLRELHVKPETVREERERKKMDRLNRMKSRMGADDSRSNANLLKFAK